MTLKHLWRALIRAKDQERYKGHFDRISYDNYDSKGLRHGWTQTWTLNGIVAAANHIPVPELTQQGWEFSDLGWANSVDYLARTQKHSLS